jgi:hypothetical protein
LREAESGDIAIHPWKIRHAVRAHGPVARDCETLHATVPQIATFLKDVEAIIDAHYLGRALMG